MDYNIELCSGCFRTLDEIGSWTTMSDNEKLKIIKELEFRKNFHKNSNG